jgi:hypothetical protein
MQQMPYSIEQIVRIDTLLKAGDFLVLVVTAPDQKHADKGGGFTCENSDSHRDDFEGNSPL